MTHPAANPARFEPLPITALGFPGRAIPWPAVGPVQRLSLSAMRPVPRAAVLALLFPAPSVVTPSSLLP